MIRETLKNHPLRWGTLLAVFPALGVLGSARFVTFGPCGGASSPTAYLFVIPMAIMGVIAYLYAARLFAHAFRSEKIPAALIGTSMLAFGGFSTFILCFMALFSL